MTLPVVEREYTRKFDGTPNGRQIARVIVKGEFVEGRGADREAALVDLVDRLTDRLESCR